MHDDGLAFESFEAALAKLDALPAEYAQALAKINADCEAELARLDDKVSHVRDLMANAEHEYRDVIAALTAVGVTGLAPKVEAGLVRSGTADPTAANRLFESAVAEARAAVAEQRAARRQAEEVAREAAAQAQAAKLRDDLARASQEAVKRAQAEAEAAVRRQGRR